MRLSDKLAVLGQVLRWRLTWSRRDLDFCPDDVDADSFMSARDAVSLIADGSTVISCGMAANARCSALFWAVAEAFQRSGRPRDLTWIAIGGQGGRGRVPGTVEEIGLDGLLACFISGHTETCRSILRLAAAGRTELHVMPQGEMTALLEAQARGETWVTSDTGVGTFLDPRVGRGSAVTPCERNLVEVCGTMLRYTLPDIDIAMFSAPYADRHGNVYFRHAATITENIEAAHAARANGGKVLAVVSGLTEYDPEQVSLHADEVDAIVVNPFNEQTGSVPQKRFWASFTPGGDGADHRAIARLRYINRILKITPRRGPVEQMLARLGALTFAREVEPGATVNIGVGFGEEVCRLLYESPLATKLKFTTETGVYGGMPAPGIFFGAAVNPERMESSAWMFRHYRQCLSATVLGFLQVDSAGNVNVSKRADDIADYVGPGGFPSIVASARCVFFVGTWMAHAQWEINAGRLRLSRPGTPKFVAEVDELTFSGEQALLNGKRVFYITNIGVLELTAAGLVLSGVMPGVDIRRDVLDATKARILLPDGGAVPIIPECVVSGDGFALQWGGLRNN